jgi:hypothetical protein
MRLRIIRFMNLRDSRPSLSDYSVDLTQIREGFIDKAAGYPKVSRNIANRAAFVVQLHGLGGVHLTRGRPRRLP